MQPKQPTENTQIYNIQTTHKILYHNYAPQNSLNPEREKNLAIKDFFKEKKHHEPIDIAISDITFLIVECHPN